MRAVNSLLAIFLLISCTGNHLHDGVYKATVFTDPSWTWVMYEVIEINGNQMVYKSYDLGNTLRNELKTTCVQYPDRVEFKGKDGITVVARFDESGNLKYGDYTYKLLNGEPDSKESTKDDPVSKPQKKSDKVSYRKLAGKTENSSSTPPFIGKRYFNFEGGSGTGESITIEEQDADAGYYKLTVTSYPCCGAVPRTEYVGKYTNPFIVSGIKYRLKGNSIEMLDEGGSVQMGCMGEGKPCRVALEF